MQCILTKILKPWFHVQLLHAIILGSGRGYRSLSISIVWRHFKNVRWRSVTVITYSYYQPLRQQRRFHFSCKRKRKRVKQLWMHNLPCSNGNTSSTSRDSTKRCYWLQHLCLMNIFHHVWKPAIIACRNAQRVASLPLCKSCRINCTVVWQMYRVLL